MPRLDKTHEVAHSAEQMFDLVCDVECYPEFVPLCQSLGVKSRREKGSRSLILADMTMAYKMLSATFTTQVLMDREALKVEVKYIDGPFKHLDNEWRFEVLDNERCRVHFMIDYELRNRMLAMAAGAVFEMAFERFVGAFEQRANKIYA